MREIRMLIEDVVAPHEEDYEANLEMWWHMRMIRRLL